MTDVGRPAMTRARPTRMDVVFAAAYAALFVGETLLALRSKALHLPVVGGQIPLSTAVDLRFEVLSYASMGLVLACAVALAWRRARPEASFIAICAIACVQVALGEAISLWNVAMPVSLFSAAAYADRGFGRIALGISVLAYIVFAALLVDLPGRLPSLVSLSTLSTLASMLTSARAAALTGGFALILVTWVAGDQLRASRERADLRVERARQAEREREANERIGTMAERQRIARELHDVVAHGLSVMIVQADGALYAEAEHPEAPRQALATIAATGRESLAEMRQLLGVLRDDPDAAHLAPQPGLEALPGLVERFTDAGLDIGYHVEGVVRPVPPAIGLTAYRVVQESLTNVLHHAGTATRVEVRVAFLPFGLGITVRNDPGSRPAPPDAGARRGWGLLGMHERVNLLGGRMTAVPTPAGGFVVEAEIPDRSRTAWPTPTPTPTPAPGAREEPA